MEDVDSFGEFVVRGADKEVHRVCGSVDNMVDLDKIKGKVVADWQDGVVWHEWLGLWVV